MPRVMGKYTLPTSIALTTGVNMFIIFKGSNTLSPSKLFLHMLYSVYLNIYILPNLNI